MNHSTTVPKFSAAGSSGNSLVSAAVMEETVVFVSRVGRGERRHAEQIHKSSHVGQGGRYAHIKHGDRRASSSFMPPMVHRTRLPTVSWITLPALTDTNPRPLFASDGIAATMTIANIIQRIRHRPCHAVRGGLADLWGIGPEPMA